MSDDLKRDVFYIQSICIVLRDENQWQASDKSGELRRKGFAFGFGSFLAGYLLFFLLKGKAIQRSYAEGAQIASPLFGNSAIELPALWKLNGWGYYVAHNANLEYHHSEGFASGFETMNWQPHYLESQDFLFWLIPIAVLLVGGFLLTKSLDESIVINYSNVGSRIVLGFFPLAVLGVFLFTWSNEVGVGFGSSVTISIKPHLLTSMLMVGLVYPYTFGSLGGLIYSKVSSTDASSEVTNEEVDSVYCEACGSKNEIEASYCTECGETIEYL